MLSPDLLGGLAYLAGVYLICLGAAMVLGAAWRFGELLADATVRAIRRRRQVPMVRWVGRGPRFDPLRARVSHSVPQPPRARRVSVVIAERRPTRGLTDGPRGTR